MQIYVMLKKPIKNHKSIHWETTDLKHVQEMSIPDFLIIEEDTKETKGFFLYRYKTTGKFCGDTWHESLEYAKEQAHHEYGDSVEKWEEIPEGHNPLLYIVDKLKNKKYKQDYPDLNDILNEWDFLDVVDEDNQDEYKDLIDPILSELEKRITQKELSEFIVNYIAESYSAIPQYSFETAEKILKWWNKN
jgi:hypothetical protein